MIEAAILAVAVLTVAFVWHVHKTLERIEALLNVQVALIQHYIDALYSLAHTTLEQYAAALNYPQDDKGVRYA